MSEYESQKRDLEDDLEKLQEATDTANQRRSEVNGWEIPDLWDEDDLDLDEARGYVQTMCEAAAEIASILDYARIKVQERLDNLYVEEPCDDCGEVIVNDRDELHADECERVALYT